MIDIDFIFFDKEFDQIKVAIVAASVESIDFGVSGQVSIEEIRLFGKEFFDLIDFIPINVVTQILIVRVEMSDALDSTSSHLKISK